MASKEIYDVMGWPMENTPFVAFTYFYYTFYILLSVIGYKMITNLNEALEQNKRLVNETFRVTQEWEKTKAELIVLKDKMNSQPAPGNPFYRNISDRELVEKLSNAEAALKNSEDMNLKLTRSRKDLEKQLLEMEKQIKETNLKLLTFQGHLKTKDDENAALKARLAMYDNKEGAKQKIEELSALLVQKDTLLGVAWAEAKMKDRMLEDAGRNLHKLIEERCIIFEQSQNLKSQLNVNENLKMGNESSLKQLVHQKEIEFQQIKVENNHMAQIIFGHEEMKNRMEEKIRSLEYQLEAYKAHQMQNNNNMTTLPSMMQPAVSGDFMTQVMENMNRMQMEIQRLNNAQQPRK